MDGYTGSHKQLPYLYDKSVAHQFGLTAEEFAELFIKHIICKFSLPDSIITDCDPKGTLDFWKGVAQSLKTSMVLSLAHHLQHDGQTEILNQQLITMMRAYVVDDLSEWLT